MKRVDTERESGDAPEGFRSGFVALVGRPNVGKSTLLNVLVGQTIAIVTPRPQTTRSRIRGIINRTASQIVLVDTPGMHLRDQAINRYMLAEAKAALSEVDLVVVMVEAAGRGRRPGVEEEDRLVLESVKGAGRPALLAINKIDKLDKKTLLLPVIEAYHRTSLFDEIIPISALTQDGLEQLLVAIESRLPVGPCYFPEDQVTDQPERQLAAELIREQVILNSGEEVPYGTAVEIVSFEERTDSGLVWIGATIFVERDSQKGILIGKRGHRLKAIGTAARLSIEALLERRVHLDLRVKVARHWSKTDAGLRSVGYRKS